MRPELKFVKRMHALFGPPGDGDCDAMIAEYVNVLAGQSEVILDRAADYLARTHKFRIWPTVAECLDAVSAAKRMSRTAAIGLTPIEDFDGWWSERLARVAIARTERDLEDQIGMVEPYANAGWIHRSRLPTIIDAANARRKQLVVDSAASVSRRMNGEAHQ